MRKKNKLMIAITIVFALAVAGVVLGYLYMETDIFKSNKELFFKYLSQHIEKVDQISELKTLDIYNQLKNENRYVSNTKIGTTHSEGGEISNPLNNLTANLDIQKDNEQQYTYIDGQILYENEESLEAELIKEQDIYGVRFTDAVKQFVSVKKDENTELVAEDIGIDGKELQLIIDTVDETGINISLEKIKTLKDRYLNIITQELLKGEFQKQKDAMITYNNVSTETNAYSVSLTGEQLKNVIVQILNNVKEDAEILDIVQRFVDKSIAIENINGLINSISEKQMSILKITVYENKEKTIRTVIEVADNKIVIENENEKTKINVSNINHEQVEEYLFEINKQTLENQENIEIKVNIIKGEENYLIQLISEMKKENDNIKLKTELSYKQEITTISLLIENETKVGESFEKIQTLSSENNIIISPLEQERRKSLIKVLNEIIPQKINERISVLQEKLGIVQNGENQISSEDVNDENNTNQIEVNKFNSKFEFYTGDEVTAENIKSLLNVVQNNLLNYETIQAENSTEDDVKETLKLIIEKDKVNEEAVNQIKEKINDREKYKVSIVYKEGNGIIDYITITQI